MTACPFCDVAVAEQPLRNGLAFAIYDRFPVAPGHTLIIPDRHVASYFEITADERLALWSLVEEAKLWIDREFRPDGYNIGINVGAAAGQTVPHLHIHLIPRYAGDMNDPRGGVRGVIPDRQKY
ncbi:MAG: HIT domain-containing protein [Gammaproteobacteria bacterium]|nr:HIT domain-containing protein [Gammaproteobacteria bacterium]